MNPVCFVRVCTIHVFLILLHCLSSSSSSSSSPFSVCVQSVNEALLSDFWFTISTELYTFFFFLRSPTSVNFIYLCMSYTHAHIHLRACIGYFGVYMLDGTRIWKSTKWITCWQISTEILFVLLQLYGIVGALRLQFNLHTRINTVWIFHSVSQIRF